MAGYDRPFEDRADAGRRLAERVARLGLEKPIVYALPRGGAPVAAEVALRLHAPLDVLLVRKIGAPGRPELALGAVVDGEGAQTVVNEDVALHTGAGKAYLDQVRTEELQEIERRRAAYGKGHEHLNPAGRTAVIVDDGLATGASAKCAVRALKRQGAAKVVVAVPVSPVETLEEMESEADEVVCLYPADFFPGVGAFYVDFHQMDDQETLDSLARVWKPDGAVQRREVTLPPHDLAGDLQVPADAHGLVLFAHGSGSSRRSPRNRAVAASMNERGLATLLFDLLHDDEAEDRRNVFDISLLAERLQQAAEWIADQPELAQLPLGLFGSSTGAAAALQAAARLKRRVSAVVSRGGRPDLAGPTALAAVEAPTLLVVGGADYGVIELNEAAYGMLTCEKRLELVPGATHLFEEPGTLEQVMRLAGEWFDRHARKPH